MNKESYNMVSDLYAFAKVDLSEISNTHKDFEYECYTKISSLSLEKKLLENSEFISHDRDLIAIKNINSEIDLIFTSLRLMYELSLLSIYRDVENNLSNILEKTYFTRESDEECLRHNKYICIKYIDINNNIKYYSCYKQLYESIYLINNPSSYSIEFHNPYKVNNKLAVSHLSKIYNEVSNNINPFIYEICLHIEKDLFVYSDTRLKDISKQITKKMNYEQSIKLSKYIKDNTNTNIFKYIFNKMFYINK